MKNSDIKLYNVLFPFWMLLLFPQMWAIVLPGNFIIDSIVLIISMFALKMTEKKRFYKRHIFQIWGFGMLSDVIGAAYMFLLMWAFEVGSMGDELDVLLIFCIIGNYELIAADTSSVVEMSDVDEINVIPKLVIELIL